MSNYESFQNITRGVFNVIASVGLIVGAAWAYHEYHENKDIWRMDKTQNYIDALATDDVKVSERYLIEFWSDFDWDAHRDANKKEVMIDVVESDITYQFHLKNILLFLDGVRNCVNNEVCHKEMAVSNLRGLYIATFINHHAWIVHNRENTGHKLYYADLECFVRKEIRDFPSNLECA